MIAMIRINLIGSSKGRRRRSGVPDIPNVGVLLFALLLVIEGAVLYSWHAGAVEKATNVRQKLNRYNHELQTLQEIQTQMDGLNKELKELKKNTWLFDELAAQKRGPVDALTFLAFILHDRDEATHPSEEILAMEAAGWHMGWKANRAWFTSIRESRGEVTLKGEAINHQDVAEVLRRLESSAHFREVHLVYQEVKRVESVEMSYVEFAIKASLIYLIDPVNKSPAAEEGDKTEAPAGDEPAEAPPRMPSAFSVPKDRPSIEEPALPAPVTTAAQGQDEQAEEQGAAPEGSAAGEKIGLPSLDDLLEAR